MMRLILLAGAALALSACGGGETEANEANAMGAENMMMDQNMAMDPNMSMDANMTMDPNMAMDGNAAGGANAQEAMAKDATTNDPDTNLANGM